jgi:hypothetical protein
LLSFLGILLGWQATGSATILANAGAGACIDVDCQTASDAQGGLNSQSASAFASVQYGGAQGVASAYAEFGLNRVYAEGFGTLTDSGDGAATSVWEDQFTILGGTGTGTATLTITLTGRLINLTYFQYDLFRIGTGAAEPFPTNATIVSTFGNNVSFCCPGPAGPIISVDLVGILDFSYGIPFNLKAQLYAQAGAGGPFYPSHAVADFMSTAILTGFDLPPGATLQSLSGTTYPLVPEPALLALLGIGLAVPLIRARIRGRKSPSSHR